MIRIVNNYFVLDHETLWFIKNIESQSKRQGYCASLFTPWFEKDQITDLQ